MVRQSNVKGAYAKVGDPSVKRGSGYGRCMAVAGVIVFFLFFMSLGDDNSANDETQNMGQAHHATTAIDIPGSTGYTSGGPTTGGYNGGGTATGGYNGGGTTTGGYNGNEGGAEALEDIVDEAVGDIQQAEEEQLEESKGMLGSALSSIGNSLRIGMGKMLGSNVSDEELEEIAKEVEGKLAETVTSELQEDAEGFLSDEVNKIDNNVDNEEAEGQDYTTIESDVMDQEQDAVIHVREEISNAAIDMKAGLRGRAAEIEKQILEERLSLRLGKKVKLVVVGDEIEGVGDLFNGLPSLGGSPANGAGNGGYRNNAPQQQQQQQGGYRNNVPQQQQQQQQQGGYRNNVPQQQQQGGYRNSAPKQQQQTYQQQRQPQDP